METQNVISNNGKKWIKYFIVGLLLLSGLCFVSYHIAYDSAKEYYYGQLENLIIDRYLEGNESFGIYLYTYTDGKTTLNYPGKYTEDWNLYFK